MATIDSKDIIKVLLEHNGCYYSDPQVSSVWTYKNMYGDTTHAVFTHEQFNDLDTSPFVRNAELLWSRAAGMTDAGKEYLKILQLGDK